MSVFRQFLASVGIGAATVNTRLDQEVLVPGEMLSGEVHIQGGEVSQEIDDIYLYVVTRYEREVDDRKVSQECRLVKHHLLQRFTLQPHEVKVVVFEFQLPYETPLTIGRQPVYLTTALDIKTAINPRDRDRLEIRPHPLMAHVLTAVESLGFRLQEVDCEYSHFRGHTYPFLQEFEFRPLGSYRRQLDELEVVFFLRSDRLEVLLQIDKRARSFAGWMESAFNLDERYVRFHVTEADLDLPVSHLAALIDATIQNNLR